MSDFDLGRAVRDAADDGVHVAIIRRFPSNVEYASHYEPGEPGPIKVIDKDTGKRFLISVSTEVVEAGPCVCVGLSHRESCFDWALPL